MGIVIKHHPKLVERWKNIFISVYKSLGKPAADEWALRTLTDEDTNEVAKILHSPSKKK